MLVIVGVGVSAMADRKGHFEQDPRMRRRAEARASAKSQKAKAEAKKWAEENGVKVRGHTNGKTFELMEIRNGRPRYRTTRNSNAAISTASNLVRDNAPYHLNGAGVTVGIWDGDSVLTNHQEFAGGRVSILDAYDVSYSHGTHVAGTIGASGVKVAAKGMAPAAFIDSYEWNDDFAEMAARAASYPGESNKLYLSNHSYGDDGGWSRTGAGYTWYGEDWSATAADSFFGQYEEWARNLDEITYNAPYYLQFKAAGNDREDNPAPGDTVKYEQTSYSYDPAIHPAGDNVYKAGYDTIPTDGNAKNILTVGSVSDAVSGGLRSPSSAVPISRSSWGPADDGRIKPDVVANGEALYSTGSASSSHYYTESGTSMASPNACGSAALLIQHFSNLFSGRAMRASSLKALILHTADDIGRPGPDYQYGWGLMNTLAAAEQLSERAAGASLRLMEELLSDADEAHTYYFSGDSNRPIRVTLCWTDVPNDFTEEHDDRVPDLVNDLDLKLIAPDGTIHYPFMLDYNNPTNIATAVAANEIDNVEQVYISVPQKGTYTVVVDYEGALTDNAQWYSMLISGDDGSDSDADGMPDVWEELYFGGATTGLASADPDMDGSDNLAEYVAGYSPFNSNDVFNMSAYFPPQTGGEPPVINWISTSGRLYNVSWSPDLMNIPFSNISGTIGYPSNQFIDISGTVTSQQFYRVDVRLDN